MRVLGAVLAGGRSSRFGSDKAEALFEGKRLIDRALEALAGSVQKIVICGRIEPGHDCLTDRPSPGLGPLGGLSAALHHGAGEGFEGVLSVPLDVHPLPCDLLRLLCRDGPRYLAGQFTIGFWPTRLAPLLDAHIAAGGRSMRSWIRASAAAPTACDALKLLNINRPEDLAHFEASEGSPRWSR